ncbi:MAG: FAD:protein FMN transferase [Myxococcota bacterium]
MVEDASSNRQSTLLIWPLLLGALIVVTGYIAWLGLSEAPTSVTTFQGQTMGTTYRVTLAEALPSSRASAIHAAFGDELETINRQMSTWDPDSEISAFNRYRGTDPFPVSPAFAQVVKDGLEVSALSNGAFDITVGPLVDAWGFGPSGRPERVPSPEDLETLKARVGHSKLQVRDRPPALTKRHPELAIDLSAIAKGYAVDRLAEILETAGVRDYLVEIGGEVRALGTNRLGQSWRLGIEEPVRGVRNVRAVVQVDGGALATSGNYRNSYELDGVRYVHTLDPETGKPVRHPLALVSILHERCALADAWATALMVVGPERALELARAHDLEAYVVFSTSDGFREEMTEGFRARRVAPDDA